MGRREVSGKVREWESEGVGKRVERRMQDSVFLCVLHASVVKFLIFPGSE
jgi:hypothetical protein